MFEEYQICPYTGLRSFTEEESLYFKGREEHIASATEQLQRNKFLMLTGASGDGKSSLVYAGIVPNARSGFLKSKYSQWRVADFRPERSPFKNLSKAIAKQLGITNVSTVESELQHGFSALVDLYKNSKRFIDFDSAEWKQLNETTKANTKRETANLIILVDQFEEFFTNPENYHNGVPSRDSNLVLNLLLETARIALEENLPIYIVFTMRSDFIGQCAAFRGLPEYIGFSQFFVPRLNRSQLQQVIEEPASLSGNRITRRLTERLIHDITDGVDQLPILQHALNQIWVAANSGKEEMDLLHYALVGGMAPLELPEEHTERFRQWFDAQTAAVQSFYREPNLQNVLDTHTNKLYEQAAAYYTSKTNKPISQEDAKAIIKNTFTCLTKIDQSRAVRNRMTLREIVEIFGKSEFDAAAFGALLNVFREPGNTFIRPFITEDEESRVLTLDNVLDITHESLIRNWEYLGKWAKEEFDSYSVSIDFGKQLNRWVKSGKANSHLFSIGPLTYFETWFNKVKPNIWWIARYLPEEIEQEKKLSKARRILSNAREFLDRSARKHVVTRTIMRYGPLRIAAVLGVIAIITLSSFAVRNYLQRQNSFVLETMHRQIQRSAGDPKIVLGDKVTAIVEEMKMGRTSVKEAVAGIQDPIQKINIADGIATLLIFQGWTEPRNEIMTALAMTDSLLNTIPLDVINTKELTGLIKECKDFHATLELGYYYRPDPQIHEFKLRNAKRAARYCQYIVEHQPNDFKDILNFELALENAINYKALSPEALRSLLTLLSPLENTKPSEWLRSNFDRDKLMIRGSLNYGLKHNGLYQLLAYLYGAEGNTKAALQCVDTLLRTNESYFQNDYTESMDNAANIAAVFYSNHHLDQLDAFVAGYCEKKKMRTERFYYRLLARTWKSQSTVASLNLFFFTDVPSSLNLCYSDRQQTLYFHSKYLDVVAATIASPDERNFLNALTFKNEALSLVLNKEKPSPGELSINQLFDKAIASYNKIGKAYREEVMSVPGIGNIDDMRLPRSFLFIYPDRKVEFTPQEARNFFYSYSSDAFLAYILDNNLFDSLYPSRDELSYLTLWLSNYNSTRWIRSVFATENARAAVLTKLESLISNRKENADVNLLYLYLGLESQKAGNQEQMLAYYRKIEDDNIFNILRSKEYGNEINNHSFRLIGYAVKGFAQSGHLNEAHHLIRTFKKSVNRSSLYAFAAVEMLLEKSTLPVVQQLIDSSRTEMDRAEILISAQPNKELLAYAITLQHPSESSEEASRLTKNLRRKFEATQHLCQAFAFNQDLFQAQEHIPKNLSDNDRIIIDWFLLYGLGQQTGSASESWKRFDANYIPISNHWISYIEDDE